MRPAPRTACPGCFSPSREHVDVTDVSTASKPRNAWGRLEGPCYSLQPARGRRTLGALSRFPCPGVTVYMTARVQASALGSLPHEAPCCLLSAPRPSCLVVGSPCAWLALSSPRSWPPLGQGRRNTPRGGGGRIGAFSPYGLPHLRWPCWAPGHQAEPLWCA